jgi:molybdopterin-biosynthesis enzyme MoeA-like protein
LNSISHFGAIIIDEILSGNRQDAHLAQVIAILKARGLSLAWAEFLGDVPERITAVFNRSMATTDVVFSFGGIGATPDDHTRQSAATVAGLPLEPHAGAVAEIEAQFGEAAYPKRVLMASLPKGAALIPNPVNRVAGFSVGHHHFLPGFPQMAWPMMEWVLDTHYSHLFHQHPLVEAAILVMEAGESQLIDLMNAIVQKHPETKLFSLPKLGPNKTIELGVKGPAEAVENAMAEIKSGVSAAGFEWLSIT